MSNDANPDTTGPSKTTGQYHSVKGTVVETIGNLTGATSWQNSGKEEHAAGEAEINAAQTKAYAEGAADRVQGKVESISGAITGDRNEQMRGNAREEAGKQQMKYNEPSSG